MDEIERIRATSSGFGNIMTMQNGGATARDQVVASNFSAHSNGGLI